MACPFEHHSFRNLLEERRTVVSTSEADFTLRSYRYEFWDYRNDCLRKKWWHLITMTGVTSFLKHEAVKRGLLLVDGIYVCVSCQTSEYVAEDEKLNLGTATCTRCKSTFRGWE